MRSMILPAFAVAVLAASPALAQSGQQSGSQQNNKQATSQTTSQTQTSAMSQDALRKQLQQAGFKNIQVIDAAYLVQAQTQDGNTVFMTINPPPMSGSSSSSSQSGSGSSSGSTGKSGSSQQ